MMNPDPGKVLVVDDEASVRETVLALLQKCGFAVTAAANGAEALRLAEAQDFDAVLLDLRMPGMDGMTVFRKLKERNYPAEVIFLTAYGTIGSAVDALKMGALDYLVKPGAIYDLPAKTLQAVQLHRRKQKGLLTRAVQDMAEHYGLTPKQSEVCENLIAGRSNAEIAQQMGISQSTVKSHLKKVFERLAVESRTELAARIFENLNGEI